MPARASVRARVRACICVVVQHQIRLNGVSNSLAIEDRVTNGRTLLDRACACSYENLHKINVVPTALVTRPAVLRDTSNTGRA